MVTISWLDLFKALALVFVLEGVFTVISPRVFKQLVAQTLKSSERELRVSGLVSMLVGLAILYMAR